MTPKIIDIIGITMASLLGLALAGAWVSFVVKHLVVALRRRSWRARARRNVCIHCEHSLAGVKGDQCPECGKDGRLASLANRGTAFDAAYSQERKG